MFARFAPPVAGKPQPGEGDGDRSLCGVRWAGPCTCGPTRLLRALHTHFTEDTEAEGSQAFPVIT